jgi:hypothetical protein
MVNPHPVCDGVLVLRRAGNTHVGGKERLVAQWPTQSCLILIDQFDSPHVAPTFKGWVKPNAHYLRRKSLGHHRLTKRNHVGVVVLPSEPGRFNIPTEGAANSPDPIGHHRFTVARTARHDAAFGFTYQQSSPHFECRGREYKFDGHRI